MNRLLGSSAVLLGVFSALLPAPAGAEIYGWVDPSGSFTYSNLPPPKNARVIEIIQEEPPPDPATLARAKAAADAAHEAQLQALNDRVRQLEREAQQVQRQPPPPVPYPVASAPPPGSGCDSDYFDCGVWSGPAYYTIGTLEPWRFPHRGDGHFRGTHHMPHHPGSGPGPGRRSGPNFHR